MAVSPDSQNVYVRGTGGLAVLDRVAGDRRDRAEAGVRRLLQRGRRRRLPRTWTGWPATGGRSRCRPTARRSTSASTVPGGVSIFNRAPDGTLEQRPGTCISAEPHERRPPGTAARTATTASRRRTSSRSRPTAATVYAGGEGGLTAYRRDGDGGLTEAGCYGAAAGCTPVAVGLAGVLDIAATPDSNEVVAARLPVVDASWRSPATRTSALTQRPGARGCLSATGSAGQCLPLAPVGDDWMRIAMDPPRPRFYLTSRYGMLATVTRDFAPTCDSIETSTAVNTALSIPLTCSDVNGDAVHDPEGRRRRRRDRSARSSTGACSTTRSAASSGRTRSRIAR